MAYRLKDLARKLNAELIGDPDVLIESIGSPGAAEPGQIVLLKDLRYRHRLQNTRASALLVGTDGKDLPTLPRLVCDAPYTAFAELTRLFHPLPRPCTGVHSSASVGDGCEIGDGTSVAAGVVIGSSVTLGEDCVIGPNLSLIHI